MVLALEPHVGYWHLQDLILVTSAGPKVLSDRFERADLFEPYRALQRIFPADFGERRTISEGYLNSCSIM